MSTKIYNGFILPHIDFEELHHSSMNMRQLLRKKIAHSYNKFLAEDITTTLDKDYHKGTIQNSYLTPAYLQLTDRIRKIGTTGLRDPQVDFSFEVSILPNFEDNIILGICYTEREDWVKLWLKTVKAKDYSYWNNTDKPSNISNKTWQTRREMWDKVVGHDIVSMKGFTLSLTNEYDACFMPNTPKLLANVPSYNSRLSELAKDVLWDNFILDKKVTTKAVFRIMHDFSKFLNEDTGKSLLSAEIERLKAFLPEVITKEMIT